MKALLYCCKSKPYINKRGNDITDYPDYVFATEGINGTIPCECDYDVEEISVTYADYYHEELAYNTNTLSFDELLEESCLDNQQLDNYLYGDNGKAIHIKNLHIFDKPKRLNEYTVYTRIANCIKEKRYTMQMLNKAPQNMCYVWDEHNIKYALISIRPEWLCKILNGEKKIEVRRKVLKEMIK